METPEPHPNSYQTSHQTLSYGDLVNLTRQAATGLKKLKVAVMGDASTQWLVIALNGYARAFGFELEIYEAGFDQIDSEVLNPASGLYRYKPDYLVVIETSRRMLEKYRAVAPEKRGSFAEQRLLTLENRIKLLQERLASRIIWFDYEPFSDGVYGGFGANTRDSFEVQLTLYNAGLWERISRHQNLYLFKFGHLITQRGLAEVFDSRLFYMAEAPYSLNFVPVVARNLIQMIASLEGFVRKCLILDLDNTLWGGTVGDLGPAGVEIGNLGLGRAFADFQNWALELKRRGVILCICSKNEDENARAPFLERPEMRLGLDDFAVFVANWKPKHENIQQIQTVLNIGFDSMVFVDDNPLERDSVRRFLPDVLVPELPADPEDYVGFLSSLNLFDAPQVTREDTDRTRLYQTEQRRQSLQGECSSFDDYLASLGMLAEFEPMNETSQGRLAQLFQRSNQFNTRTIRYSESDLAALVAGGRHAVYSCRLKDQFGDHGIISAVVLEWRDHEGFLDNWVMSCRVFNRQVEHYLANKFVDLAYLAGKTRLVGERLPTKKNKVIENLFRDLGFQEADGLWSLELATATSLSHHLQEAVPHE